jgi:membrane associated rhomboid family serine protease
MIFLLNMIIDDIIHIENSDVHGDQPQSLKSAHVKITLMTLGLSLLVLQWPLLKFLLGLYSENGFRFFGLNFISSIFIHGNLPHLMGNILIFLLCAPSIEEKVGDKQFYVLYFTSGVLAGFVSYFMQQHLPQHISLGASGAIYGLIAYATLAFTNLKVVFLIELMSIFGLSH